jgi:Site-specific recombinase XerD
MSRYPFQTVVNEVLATKSLDWSEINTIKMTARYDLMRREFESLYEKGLVSTMNPKKMKVEDIKAYLEFCRKKIHPRTGKPISAGEIKRTIGTLRHIVEYPYKINQTYSHNRSLEYCLKLFPHLKPKVYFKRLPCWTEEQFQTVMQRSTTVDPMELKRLRAYALACLSACAGDRNKEIRYANVEDIDIDRWEFIVKHPKGEDTYGDERCVSIEPECHHIVKMYLEYGLPAWHELHPEQKDNPALFPSYVGDGVYLTDKTILKALKVVQAEVGFTVTYQITRRTYFQRLLRRGVSKDAMRVMAGHSDTYMIDKHYAGLDPEDARKEIIETRKKNEKFDRPENDCSDSQIEEKVPRMGFEPMTFGFPWKRSY